VGLLGLAVVGWATDAALAAVPWLLSALAYVLARLVADALVGPTR
jgi:hypothetical protein